MPLLMVKSIISLRVITMRAFDNTPVKSDSVIGKYTGKWVGVGNVVLFLQSSTGFLVCVVVPSLLVLAYAIYDFIRSYKVYHSEKVAVDEVALKEKLRAEILAENASSTQKQNEEKVEDKVEPKVEEPKTETENSTPVQKDNDNKDNK
jgi:signal peptidase